MGRSRITRTFHNKPVSKPKKGPVGKPKNTVVKPTKTTYKRRAGKIVYKKRDENIRRPVPGEVKNDPTQRGNLLPQAHAQEELPAGTRLTGYTKDHLDQSRATTPDGKDAGIIETVVRTKTGFRAFGPGSSGKGQKSLSLSKSNIKKEKYASGELVNVQYGMNPYTPASDTEGRAIDKKYYPDETATGKKRTILGKFAQGVSNEAQDMVGIPHGFITGNNYKTKSILSRATEHVLAGDWGSAGSVISNNPYRFAGNIATTVGTGFIPFGAVTRGAGLAARVGSAVTKGKSKIAGKLKGKGAEKKSYAGGKYTNKEINDAERLVQQSEWMGWGKVKPQPKQNVHGKDWSQMTSKERQFERSLDSSYRNYIRLPSKGLGFSEKVYKKRGVVSRHKNRKEQRFVDDEQAMERRIDDFTQSPSTGTPKWYQPREQFLAKTKGSRARLSRDRQQAEIRGSDARFLNNMKSTKPTKNSFWQNQVTKDGDDVSGWVDPDFFR